jgi:hypothetical protein
LLRAGDSLPTFIEPDSALDWHTIGQLCEKAAKDIITEAPNDPVSRRIDLFRPCEVQGRKVTVRIKLTVAYVHQRKGDR